jgi:serine beta-lactamase-like protein LACTB
MRAHSAWSCLVLSLLCTSPTDDANASIDISRMVREAAEAELRRSGVPSLQIAVARDGRVIFQEAYGWADVEQKVAATVHSKYRTGSVSKWMTATAALLLVERERLNLDTPIQQYCVHFPEKTWPITTRQLLSHTSGIRHEIDYETAILAARDDNSRLAIERRRDSELLSEYSRYIDVVTPLTIFKQDSLLFAPGTSWLYSSPGYRVVGCVLEGASNRTYNELMRELIFEKLRMTETVPDDAWAIIPQRVAGYHIERGSPLRRAEMTDVSGNLPAGGHLSTATDLVKFAQAFVTGELVSDATLALMLPDSRRPARPQNETWRDAIPSRENYGYGVMAFPSIEGQWIGHTGRQPGASTIVIASIEERLSLAVLTNAKGWNGYISFIDRLRAIVESADQPSPELARRRATPFHQDDPSRQKESAL